MYVTPEKYRTMGFGIDLEGIEDVELASTLQRAAVIVDGYCSVPRVPVQHSFLGGTISTDNPERHSWRLPDTDNQFGQRRVYPYHWPVKAITDFKIKVTNTQYVAIAPSEIFINNTERYAEIVSLAFTGVGLFGAILPTLGMLRPVSELAYTYGWEFPVVGEVLYPTDARTYRADNQFWTTDPVVVYRNGTLVNANDYTVDVYEGTIVFDDLNAPTDVISVDYIYRLPQEVRDSTAIIATHLLGERESQARGMEGVDSLKVAEVTIKKSEKRLTKDNLAYIEPEAAIMLDGFRYITAR